MAGNPCGSLFTGIPCRWISDRLPVIVCQTTGHKLFTGLSCAFLKENIFAVRSCCRSFKRGQTSKVTIPDCTYSYYTCDAIESWHRPRDPPQTTVQWNFFIIQNMHIGREIVVWFLVKSTQSKEYSIGHEKNYNKLLKSVVNAKKPKFYDVFIYFVLEFSIYITRFDFFWHITIFAIICWSFICDQYHRP